MKNLTNSWELFAIGSAFFAGLTAILGKLGVAQINSNLATLIRTVFIFLFALGVVLSRGEWQAPSSISRNTWIFLFLSALTTATSWLFYYRALQLGPASYVAPVDKLGVVVAIALGVLALGEPFSLKLFVGSALVVVGVLVLI